MRLDAGFMPSREAIDFPAVDSLAMKTQPVALTSHSRINCNNPILSAMPELKAWGFGFTEGLYTMVCICEQWWVATPATMIVHPVVGLLVVQRPANRSRHRWPRRKWPPRSSSSRADLLSCSLSMPLR